MDGWILNLDGICDSRLLLTEDNQIAFNSEESRDSEDLNDYSDQIAEMMGLGSTTEFIKSGVTSVLDIGCGFGSFGIRVCKQQPRRR